MHKILPFGICFLLSTFVLQAQEVTLTTQVPEGRMGVKDIVHVQYEIKNARNNIRSFQLEQSKDFKMLRPPSRGESFIMMNDRTESSVIYTITFKATRVGRLKFPLAKANVGGKIIQSNPVVIDVVKGSLKQQRLNARRNNPNRVPSFEDIMREQEEFFQQLFGPSPMSRPRTVPTPREEKPAQVEVTRENLGDNLFIKVFVDKKEVHVGEQITANYKLYVRGGGHVLASIDPTKLPELNNFWTHEFVISSPRVPTREKWNGKEYQVWTLKKAALFPSKTGKLVLDPAEAEGVAKLRKVTRVKRPNVLGGGVYKGKSSNAYSEIVEYEQVPVRLVSDSVTILVKDFPEEEKPAAFTGAVGSFTMESKINAAEITTDDVATLTLTIRGNGNIKLLEAPKLSLSDSIVDIFEPIEFDTITSLANDRITGYKTVKYRFTPKGTGVLKVPPITLAYYNTEAERYETIKTPEYTVRVKPGKEIPGKEILPMDIHDIASEQTKLSKERTTVLPEQMWYWGAYLIPSLGFLFLIGYKRREEYERKDKVAFKNKKANKVALKRLEQAEEHRKANEQTKFYEETSKAVWLYLSDKLNIPLSTLSKEMAGTLLRKREISQDLIDELFLITDECEIALYAPEAGDFKMNQIYSDSLKIIGTLEDKLG